MKPVTKWLVYGVCLSGGAFIGWHLGLGMWAAYSYYQFSVITGQTFIMVGVLVLLQEVERNWHEEDEE